jgi:hypothetical protein
MALRAGLEDWLERGLDPSPQRIVLIDPPTVLGWDRARELDERQTVGSLRGASRCWRRAGPLQGRSTCSLPWSSAPSAKPPLVTARSPDQGEALDDAKSAIQVLLSGIEDLGV